MSKEKKPTLEEEYNALSEEEQNNAMGFGPDILNRSKKANPASSEKK